MVKLVFVDLDGTFTDSEKKVPPANVAAMERAAELGIQFVPCTGRNVNGVPAEMLASPSVRYAVCSNGASVVDVRTGEALRTVEIAREQVLALYDAVRDLPVTFDVFLDGKMYLERARFDYIDATCPNDAAQRELFYRLRVPYDCPLEELLERGPVVKVNMLDSCEEHKRAVRAAVDGVEGLHWTYSLPMNTEVLREGADKGDALAWLCEHLGVDVADSIAFGDSDNDTTMLEAAGTAVAMGNAKPSIKAIADAVTTSNDEAGVAAYLSPLFDAAASAAR